MCILSSAISIVLLGGVHVWHFQNLRGNVPFDYRAFCSELTFKLTPTCIRAVSFKFRLSGKCALKWLFHWTGKMLAFHFKVLTAGSICIASEAEFVKICKQWNPRCFSGNDPGYWGRLSVWKVTPRTYYTQNFFKRKNETVSMRIPRVRKHVNTAGILRDKSLVRDEIFFLE